MTYGPVLQKLPAILGPLPGGQKMINGVDFLVNWAKANSLWPLVYGTSCCAIEMMAAGASHHDWARFGVEVARATPRQADLIILAGTLVGKMAPYLKRLYEQMPEPKYVIAMGACTISGGPFYYDNYSVVKGADRIIPVDVFIPGCPPRPEALIYGILQLQKIIWSESIRAPRAHPPVVTGPVDNPHAACAKAWEAAEAEKDAGMAEAREQFKQENPDYKPYKQAKAEKPVFEDAPLVVPRQCGMHNVDIYELVKARFPGVELFRKGALPVEELATLGRGYLLDLVFAPGEWLEAATFLRRSPQLACDFLIQLTCVDYGSHFDICALLQSTKKGHKLALRTSLPDREQAEIDSLTGMFEAAKFQEREVYDLFGVKFRNHPDLRRLFLAEEFPGHPLRKDYDDPGRVIRRPY